METPQPLCNRCMSRVPRGASACPYCGHSFANTNPAGTLPVNTMLNKGRYTLGECITLDGEGVTYAAVDGEMSRRVVIKEYVPVTLCAGRTREGSVVPKSERAVLYKTTRMDFADLYNALASIGDCDGMVRVYGTFEENNTVYAVRAPEDGVPLLAFLQTRRVPLKHEEALNLLRPVVYAVDAMHRKGLVHRGISPETVFVSSEGKAALSGFATMGLRTADSELKSQMFEGYAAPEQYRAAEFDGPYTDVYGLAAVFYRAMTGKTPVPAGIRRRSDTLKAPRELNGEIPAFVSSALLRGMKLASVERIATPPELLEALTTPSRQDTAFRITDRQKKYLAAGAGVLALIALISALAIYSANRAEEAPSSSSSSSSSEPVTYILPNFVGEQYTDVQNNTTYQQLYNFTIEEEYSSEIESGVIMAQSPSKGTTVEAGQTVKLTVSRGPQTAVMPGIVGQNKEAAVAQLEERGIRYTIYEMENDGSYQEGFVVTTNVPEGTVLDINKADVAVYVAKAAPESTASSSAESSSSQAAVPENPAAPAQPDGGTASSSSSEPTPTA